MKTKKTTVGFINFIIFAAMVASGAGSGYFTGNYRIGIHLGIALGLMGIALYRLWREKQYGTLQKEKIIPIDSAPRFVGNYHHSAE